MTIRIETAVAVAAAAVLVVGGLPAGAGARTSTLPQQAGAVDLATEANVWIYGAVAYDRAGTSVAGVGDVNGDGLGDVLVGAPWATNNGRRSSGSAYVIFGREAPFGQLLISLDPRGSSNVLRIDGAAAFDGAGTSVARAGDVNGDGRADVVIGAPGADNGGRPSSGSAYIVFGRNAAGTVDLAALGDGGFRIDGESSPIGAGSSVAAAGDVNGDGRDDLLVGAPDASKNARTGSGSTYVVFGRGSRTSVDLAALGDAGFRIDGATAYDDSGGSVAGAGDVNGDGRADLVIGASLADANGRSVSGSAYVVFGKSSPASVDLAALADGGFRIDGASALDFAAESVAGAGDINGDGRGDLLVGAPGAGNNGRDDSGSAYVVFGKASATSVDLAALVDRGFRIDGANVLDHAGQSVAAAGDVNGDGRADVLVGAPGASNNARIGSGSAYVVFGRRPTADVDLVALGDGGFRVDGAQIYYGTGHAVAGAGDVNGDGRDDVLMGAPNASMYGLNYSGSAYVAYGYGRPELAYDAMVGRAGQRLPARGPRLVKRTGAAIFSVWPRLPRGVFLNATTGAVSGKPAVSQRRRVYTVRMVDLSGSVRATFALTVKPKRR